MEQVQGLFEMVTRLSGDGLCLCEMIVDADGLPQDYRFLAVNDRFEEYTGLKNAKGKTALELVPELERHWIDTYARVGLGRETLRFENGSVPMRRWFEVHSTPADAHGQLWILFRDVSARKAAEIDRVNALEQSRRLFDELSHRVKNSLAVVRAIVSEEARSAPEEVQEPLSRVSLRIAAIGKLYDEMSLSRAIDRVDAREYLTSIIRGLEQTMLGDTRLRIDAEIAEIELPGQQAVTIALIVNELVTNSIKHAFAPLQPGGIQVTLKPTPDGLELSVRDDGRGLSGDDQPREGLGSRLVRAFVGDLQGQLHFRTSDEGTLSTIVFPRGGSTVVEPNADDDAGLAFPAAIPTLPGNGRDA